MAYLVLEQDPFVRSDICESLEAAFPGDDVRVADSLDEISTASADGNFIVILSVSSDDMQNALTQIASGPQVTKVIAITDGQSKSANSDHPDITFLARPFSSSTLAAAVRSARDDQRARQT